MKKIILLTGLIMLIISGRAFAGTDADGDFESMSGWTETESRSEISEGGYTGKYLKINPGEREYTISGDISAQPGIYTLTAYTKNSSADGLAYISVQTEGRTAAVTVIPPSDTFKKVTVPNIHADRDGKCHISICACGGGTVCIDSLSLDASEERAEFLTGGDISELEYVEDNGGIFKRRDGSAADALQIMSENGISLARIRLFNKTGADTAVNGWYLPQKYQEEEGILRLARRANEKGMRLLLTFNYSDYWTDAHNQVIPSEWRSRIEGLSDEEAVDKLCELVYDYTYDFMTKMKNQGTEPEFVSVGNEIQSGILYPYGELYRDPDNPQWESFARLINAGYDAVKAVSPECRTVLHINMSGEYGTYSQYEYFFGKCAEYGIKYDIIGSSYYPYWLNLEITDKNKMMDNRYVVKFYDYIAKKFDKDIIIMETGYNFNEKRADGWGGQLENCGPYDDIYGQSESGQKAFMADLFAEIKSSETGRIIGDIYWDPLMINTNGKTGWAVNTGGWIGPNVVSNTTLFGFDGKMLPVFDVYDKTRSSSDKIRIFGKNTGKDNYISVNGEKIKISSDKYGEYFAQADFSDDTVITDSRGHEIFRKAPDTDSIGIIGANTSENDVYISKNGKKWRVAGKDGGILIIAEYKDGALSNVTMENMDENSRECDIPPKRYGTQIKLMFFDGTENIKPLCVPYNAE
ncbi:MAG: glycosyl hydrolase 53 family protein [Oscillospiraceae bacterium]|nr:glycosyl hydrolase 53 family protein [Oscillospiraceae bacterium]